MNYLMLRKAVRVLAHAYTILARYTHRQLEAVSIEISMVQVLRLRTNPRRVHEAKHWTPTNGPTVTQDFTMAKPV